MRSLETGLHFTHVLRGNTLGGLSSLFRTRFCYNDKWKLSIKFPDQPIKRDKCRLQQSFLLWFLGAPVPWVWSALCNIRPGTKTSQNQIQQQQLKSEAKNDMQRLT